MPIRKENLALYSEDWDEISAETKKLSGNKCQFCGAVNDEPNLSTGSIVVLTTAHLDHNPMNNSPENLRALCQRCHLRYDSKHHTESARLTRDKKKGIIWLPFPETK